MVAKTETQTSAFNLPKGAPFVPTKVPKLPKATGQQRLETTQKPRQVGVGTPLEKAAAARQAQPTTTVPWGLTAMPTQPAVGTVQTQLPVVPTAPTPEFAAIGYGGGEGGGEEPAPPPEDIQTQPPEPKPTYPEGHVTPEELDAHNAEKGYTTGEANSAGDVPVYDANGNVVGWYYKHESGAWSVTWGDSNKSPNTKEVDHYSGQNMLTAADGTVYDASDANSPYYDPELDPNNKKHFNPDKFAVMKGQTATKSSGDAAFEAKLNAIEESGLVAAAQAKRRLMAQYGQAGFAGSGQYMQEMGQQDILHKRATTEAQSDLMLEKWKVDREADIEFLRQRLEFATGEEAEQLQKDLTQMMLDRDKEEQILEQFFGAPEHLKDIFGADSFDEASYGQFMDDMAAAEKTGNAGNIYKVMADVHYVNGQLFYQSSWADPLVGLLEPDGTQTSPQDWHAYFTGGPLDGMSLQELREWLIKNGYDPDKAKELQSKYDPDV
tara:strand:+ start:1275 stop:2753 length:1479 start_codon:yes stop_codon:yes gene_type:complete